MTVARYAGVYILDAPYHADKAYDYYIPDHLAEALCEGCFVIVPFGGGNRKRVGVVRFIHGDEPAFDTKPVEALYAGAIVLGARMLEIADFLKDQTFCTYGDAVRVILPAGARARLNRSYALSGNFSPEDLSRGFNAQTAAVAAYIRQSGNRVPYADLTAEFGDEVAGVLANLERHGAVVSSEAAAQNVADKTETYVRLAVEESRFAEAMEKSPLTLKQEGALSCLAEQGEIPLDELLERTGISVSVVAALEKKGFAERVKHKIEREFIPETALPPAEYRLTPDQLAVRDGIAALCDGSKACAALLRGITGSGKTYIIADIVKTIAASGRQAIYLLPEITLTAQVFALFRAVFGERAAIYHSGMSAGERYDTWNRIRAGGADVVVGTRSAVFAPLPKLGLIVLDEEQEHTYKSEQSPRYHARDVARFRCAKENAVMLLTSATPSVESYYKAVSGQYSLFCLEQRYGEAVLPSVELVDMRNEDAESRLTAISTRLTDEIAANLAAGEQSIIYRNRRGYHNFLSCRSCGEALMCPSCTVALRLHTSARADGSRRRADVLTCHYCGYTASPPEKCPVCDSERLLPMGTGTQKSEDDLAQVFPGARIARMDADSTATKHAHDRLVAEMGGGHADILVGTQMVTKGHNFDGVTLVGITDADYALYMDDYRANERAFAQIVQVAGRAGRADRPGRALIQTYNPENETIALAAKQDYEGFYAKEIALRRAAVFPPFCDICVITVSGKSENEVAEAARLLGGAITAALAGDFKDVPLVIFGPFRSVIYKLNGRYRMRFVIKCKSNARSRALFSETASAIQRKSSNRITVAADMNPNNI